MISTSAMSIAAISNTRVSVFPTPFEATGDSAAPPPSQAANGVVVPSDEVSISESARRRAARDTASLEDDPGPKKPEELSEKEKQEVAKLKTRDQEVRAHEQAHIAALGGGAAQYTYEVGPDGRRYAVEGEVPVSIKSSTGDPRATIREARKVAQAAVAPAQPSGADYAARTRALEVERKAREDLREKKREEDGAGGATNAESGTETPPREAGADFDTGPVDSNPAAASEILISTVG